MIIEYIDTKDKIIALDNNFGLIELNKQDNIKKIINSKNAIETIKKDMVDLRIEKMKLEKYKNSFIKMLTDKNYNIKTKIPFLLGLIVTTIVSIETLNPVIICSLLGITSVAEITSLAFTYKEYKLCNILKINSIKNELNDLENDLIDEINLLNELLNDNENTMSTKEKQLVDDEQNERLTKIEHKKNLYEMYRLNCLKIKKQLDKYENLFDDSYTEKDIKSINIMHDENNKILTKK